MKRTACISTQSLNSIMFIFTKLQIKIIGDGVVNVRDCGIQDSVQEGYVLRVENMMEQIVVTTP